MELKEVLESLRETLEDYGLSMYVNFAEQIGPKRTIFLEGELLSMTTKFKYLGSIGNDKRTADSDVNIALISVR